MLRADDVLKRLQGVLNKGNGQYMAICPCHNDKKASLAVCDGEKGVVLKCLAGCNTEEIVETLGFKMSELFNENGRNRRKTIKNESVVSEHSEKKPYKADPFVVGQHYTVNYKDDNGQICKRKELITKVYEYQDGNGKAVLQVARTEQKSFPVIFKKEDGLWYWGDGGNNNILYKLPELKRGLSEGKPVFIVEGEKDVETLIGLGLCATTNKGGANKWSDQLSKEFKGAKVYILPDLDEKGKQHAKTVALSLKGTAKEVRIVNLLRICSSLPEKGDVSDLVEVLGSKALDKLLRGVQRSVVYSRIVDDADYAEYFESVHGFNVKNGCICHFKNDNWVPLCNFTALPIAEVIKDDGSGELSTSFDIVGWGHDGRRLKEVNVSADEFVKMNWPLKKWGLIANIRSGNTTKEKLREAMQAAGDQVAIRRMSYSHTGWRRINGKPVFLHGGGAIGAEDVSVELDYGFNRYDLTGVVRGETLDMNEHDRLMHCIMKLFSFMWFAGLPKGAPLLAYMFLSPLRHFLQKAGKRPSFIPFLRGRTGSGKSVMASLVLNCFGRDFSYESAHPASFDDTANGISLKLFILKDMPLLVDDYHPEANPNRRKTMEDTAQKISRMIGDGATRSRMRNDSTGQTDRPARGLCLETGEDLPNITESGVARLYVIDLKKGDVPLGEKSLSDLQKAAKEGCFSEVMRRYIEWLIPRYDALPDVLSEKYDRLLAEALTRIGGAHARIPPVVAYLALGIEMMFDFFIDVKYLSESDAKLHIDECWNAILANTEAQVKEMQGEKPVEIFIDTLRELIESHKVGLKMFEDGMRVWGNENEIIGCVDREYYYFMPGVVFGQVQKSLALQGSSFPVGKNMALKLLADDKKIEKDPKTGKNVRQVNRRGAKGWFVWMRREFIDRPVAEQISMDIDERYRSDNEERK